MSSNIVRAVAETPLFEDLPADRIAALASLFTLRTYDAGAQVPAPGDAVDRTYVIAAGAARVARVDGDGRCLAVALLDAGAVFGRVGTSEPVAGERVETLERTLVLSAAAADFQRLLVAEPSVAAAVLSGVAGRLRQCEGRLEALAFQQVPARLAQSLVELAERFGKVTTSGVRIDLRITHGQLSELVATTRETLTKVAGWLRAENIATMERRQIWVHDYARLERVAAGTDVMPGRTTRGPSQPAAWGLVPDLGTGDLARKAREVAARRATAAAVIARAS